LEPQPNLFQRIRSSVLLALPKSGATIWWLLKVIIPISLAVTLLLHFGIIAYFATWVSPVFSIVGLPGEAAIVFITSTFLTLYAPIAIIASLSMSMREITILATMCLISHNLFVESAIQKKTGSSALIMFSTRVITSFVAALLLNWALPHQIGKEAIHNHHLVTHTLTQLLSTWAVDTAALSLKMSLIITSLMILQNILKEFKIIDVLSTLFAPLMKLMGLSSQCSFLWIISQLIGLTYGSAIMIDEVNKNEISPKDANLLNYHIAINHSSLEDNMLFVAIGVPALWIFIPRFILAICIVWGIRLLEIARAKFFTV
jgi:hypothetical protein